MNLAALITDNVTEALIKIIEFTQSRHQLLVDNVNSVRTEGFVPKDLPVHEFSMLMENAIDEHARSQRLLLRDSQHVKFGKSGTFCAKPIVDVEAAALLTRSRDEFLALQVEKLLENALNQRIALELLRQTQDDELTCLLDLN
jgi:hypothetical protein